jgi:mono/diheme cytochrome c family protein
MRIAARPLPVLCLSAALVVPAAAPALDLERGRLLYENHCQSCHESVVHVREQRQARALAEVYWQATRWAVEQRLEWRYPDVNDVVQYLNNRYYQFRPQVECQ